MTDAAANRRQRQVDARERRHGLRDGGTYSYVVEGEAAPRRCRVWLDGRPRLRWWVVDLDTLGVVATGTERLLNDALWARLYE